MGLLMEERLEANTGGLFYSILSLNSLQALSDKSPEGRRQLMSWVLSWLSG